MAANATAGGATSPPPPPLPLNHDCDAAYAALFGSFFVTLSGILLSSKFLHFFLRQLGQPRVISEIIAGIVIGNTGLLTMYDVKVPGVVGHFSNYGIAAHFFVLGLEMEPRDLLRRRPTREAVLAYAGIAATFLVLVCTGSSIEGMGPRDRAKYVISLGLSMSNTSSTVLTRLITELKIGKSEIGRAVVHAAVHNDMTTMLLMAACSAVQFDGARLAPARTALWVLILAAEAWFFAVVGQRAVARINEMSPEGRPVNQWLVLVVALTVVSVCTLGAVAGYNATLNAYLIGLALPKDGRVSRLFIRKINTGLTEFVFPFYYAAVGMELKLEGWRGRRSFKDLSLLLLIGTAGKVAGSVAAALPMGFGLPEAICMGLFLNVKGHYHILAAMNGLKAGLIDRAGLLMTVIAVVGTIVYIPLVVMVVVWLARRQHAKLRMALQWQDPETELRMVVCLHGPQDVPATIGAVEMTRGGLLSPGLMVYAMDLVELTSRAEATLTFSHGVDAVEVTDEAVVEMREQISVAFDSYLYSRGEGVALRRLLAVSTYESMHIDICNAAQDSLVVLILLPFHKKQRLDGAMDDGNALFRAVNKKVLRNAPCSVGILVDRGLAGPPTQITSFSFDSFHVAVVFIGGADDREALSYAARVAACVDVHLTAIRFLPDPPAAAEHTVEMQADDDCFADFYERHVANGPVSYVEKYVTDSAETLTALRAMAGQHNLFIVGLSRRSGSRLTAGLSDWEECPELGPLGDALSSSDFSSSASVLIIQQHNPKRQEENDDMVELSFRR